nr:MAG TPA: hypothetical protein [Caudoviricetes sp.]
MRLNPGFYFFIRHFYLLINIKNKQTSFKTGLKSVSF